jgi:hypothetical protein
MAILICNLLSIVQVVLADSSVVTASATENMDLFWALKGGGPNFGKTMKINNYLLE